MEELRKKESEGLRVEELEAQRIELLPDREEMQNINVGALAVAVQGAQAGFGQANQAF